MVSPSRRAFLRALLATPLALTLDVDQLLWTPSPMVVVPGVRGISIADLYAITMKEIWPRMIRDEFFQSNPLLEYLRSTEMVSFRG